jgi:hypothetical protein
MELDLTAVPGVIDVGNSSQLAVAVSGGLAPFSYAWAPTASLDDPSLSNPLATPSQSTTYSLTVTDALGDQQVGEVDVLVAGAVLSADFTWMLVGPDRIAMDASASTGPISEYWWWCDFDGSQPLPNYITTTPGSPVCIYETTGISVNLRLDVRDAQQPPNVAYAEQVGVIPP